MRKLAKKLGVEAMSLYNHVANKDDLLDGMIEIVFSEIDVPSDDGDWRAATGNPIRISTDDALGVSTTRMVGFASGSKAARDRGAPSPSTRRSARWRSGTRARA